MCAGGCEVFLFRVFVFTFLRGVGERRRRDWVGMGRLRYVAMGFILGLSVNEMLIGVRVTGSFIYFIVHKLDL